MSAAVLEIALKMLTLVAEVTAPILVASLAVGLTVAIFQSVTQIQEMTLTFVPKLLTVALVLLVSGHWMLDRVVGFTNEMYTMIPHLLSAGT
jgi:flagellar biosynthetic protein FliQ